MAGRGRGRSTRSEGRTIARKYAVPSRYIWVGNLPDNITEGALVDLFQQFGELDRVCLQVGRNFAFVDFKYEDAAFAAMQALQGFNFAGNPIIVEFTKVSFACFLFSYVYFISCICIFRFQLNEILFDIVTRFCDSICDQNRKTKPERKNKSTPQCGLSGCRVLILCNWLMMLLGRQL